jgi:hypothetical protein
MTLHTNGAGVAICSCGGQLVVACERGCPEPDAVFRTDSRAPRRDRHRHGYRVKVRDVPPGMCRWQQGCDQPVANRTYHGRPTTKCEKHLAIVQQWEKNRRGREIKVPFTGTR